MIRERKSREAISYLLKKLGGTTEYFKLTKLLYCADRASIEKRGRPITGDLMYALPHGPILSVILDRLNGSHSEYDDLIGHHGYQISLVSEEPPAALSFADLKVLDQVFDEYGNLSWQQLRAITHEFPEWKKYDRGDETWSRILIEDIGRALGKSKEEVELLKTHNREMDEVSALMTSLGRSVVEAV